MTSNECGRTSHDNEKQRAREIQEQIGERSKIALPQACRSRKQRQDEPEDPRRPAASSTVKTQDFPSSIQPELDLQRIHDAGLERFELRVRDQPLVEHRFCFLEASNGIILTSARRRAQSGTGTGSSDLNSSRSRTQLL